MTSRMTSSWKIEALYGILHGQTAILKERSSLKERKKKKNSSWKSCNKTFAGQFEIWPAKFAKEPARYRTVLIRCRCVSHSNSCAPPPSPPLRVVSGWVSLGGCYEWGATATCAHRLETQEKDKGSSAAPGCRLFLLINNQLF